MIWYSIVLTLLNPTEIPSLTLLSESLWNMYLQITVIVVLSSIENVEIITLVMTCLTHSTHGQQFEVIINKNLLHFSFLFYIFSFIIGGSHTNFKGAYSYLLYRHM